MNRREILTGGTVVTAGAAAKSFRMDVRACGAIGDGIADDASAIQAALDHLGARGGGVALLPPPKVHYRITTGLKLPSEVTLEGLASVQYPFNAGNPGACAIVADFADAQQWIIEPATRSKERAVPFNHMVVDALPDGVTYNCGVRNLLITSKGVVPFGGIRMHGCPGSIVDGVSVDRVGCGLLVNYSFGGSYRVQVHALYYGVVAWDEANANSFQIYCSHSTPWPKTVPATYRLPFMTQMAGHFADTLKLSDDAHGARPYGVLCGSLRSTSINNIFDVVIERFPGGMFLFNAYATDFRRCYIEADIGTMACAIAASRSRFGIQALHAYLAGTGAIFDFGIDVLARIFGSGILDAATFGKAPLNDGSSLLILEGISPAMPGAPDQPSVRYVGKEVAWMPLALQKGWQAAEQDYEIPAVRFDPWSHRIELRGTMAGGRSGLCFILPKSCRPARRRRYIAPGGQFSVAPDGSVHVLATEPTVSLDGLSFSRW